MTPAVAQGVQAAAEIARLGGIAPERRDDAWRTAFDAALRLAIFRFEPTRPLARGSDGERYLALRLPPRRGKFSGAPLTRLAEGAVRDGAGAVILDERDRPLHALLPGDLLAFRLGGRVYPAQQPAPTPPEWYRGVEGVRVGEPSRESLPPLLARGLEFALRRFYARHEALRERTPRVVLVRSPRAARPEDPSDLAVNAWATDLEDPTQMQALLNEGGRFLPLALRPRLITLGSLQGVEEGWLSLSDRIREGDLQPLLPRLEEVSSSSRVGI